MENNPNMKETNPSKVYALFYSFFLKNTGIYMKSNVIGCNSLVDLIGISARRLPVRSFRHAAIGW